MKLAGSVTDLDLLLSVVCDELADLKLVKMVCNASKSPLAVLSQVLQLQVCSVLVFEHRCLGGRRRAADIFDESRVKRVCDGHSGRPLA